MDMIKSRNLTSHTYNEDIASAIVSAVCSTYFAEFERFHAIFEALKHREPA